MSKMDLVNEIAELKDENKRMREAFQALYDAESADRIPENEEAWMDAMTEAGKFLKETKHDSSIRQG